MNSTAVVAPRRASRTYLPSRAPEEQLLDLATLVRDIERAAPQGESAALIAPDGTRRDLPREVFEALEFVVNALAEGQGVTVAPYDALLTTQEAAEYLGVSRPTVVRLLEEGVIPFEMRGRHRRVTLRDVVDYHERMRRERRTALREIARDGQASGRVRMPDVSPEQ